MILPSPSMSPFLLFPAPVGTLFNGSATAYDIDDRVVFYAINTAALGSNLVSINSTTGETGMVPVRASRLTCVCVSLLSPQDKCPTVWCTTSLRLPSSLQ